MTHHALPLAFLATVLIVSSSKAAAPEPPSRFILTDRALAARQKLESLLTHAATDTVLVRVTEAQRETLIHEAHEAGRCGGHELLSDLPARATVGQAREYAKEVFGSFDRQLAQDLLTQTKSGAVRSLVAPAKDTEIEKAVQDVSEANLRDTVDFLAKFPTRHHKSRDARAAIQAFKTRIEETMKGATRPYVLELIAHSSTPMNSIRLTIPGSQAASEIVVAGAHLDSVNKSWFGTDAPGADDNASGSANILEAARILSRSPALSKTVEFYWYAGEEGGLLGSSEIAQAAKSKGKKIVGVLQLDMTLFPGDGEFTLGSMTDFTSQSMRDVLSAINLDYIGAKIIEDKCGYGCSDHASWYRQGYPTLMPFESTPKRMNPDIHSDRDVVSRALSYRHSAMFSKIAVAFLMTLGR